MTTYQNCAVTNISLDKRECTVFVISKKTNKPFGLPFFCTYNKKDGTFIFKQNIENSFLIFSKFENKNYTLKKHLQLFSVFENDSFFLLPVLSSVYNSLLSLSSKESVDNLSADIFKSFSSTFSFYENYFLLYEVLKFRSPIEAKEKEVELPFLTISSLAKSIENYRKDKSEHNLFMFISELVNAELLPDTTLTLPLLNAPFSIDEPFFYDYLRCYKDTAENTFTVF